MKLKTSNKKKTGRINIRCYETEENKIVRLAMLYAEGNVSEYVLYAALNFVPSKEDFEKEIKPRGKK